MAVRRDASVDAPRVAAPAPPTAPAVPLLDALRALRPRIEIIPEGCDEHACLRDAETGRVRASRGFASLITTARIGDEILVAPRREMGSVETIYTGALWRWKLSDDTLSALSEPASGEWDAQVQASSFGVVVDSSGDTPDHQVMLYDGRRLLAAPDEIAVPDRPFGQLIPIGGTTFEFAPPGGVLAVLRRDGDEIVREPIEALDGPAVTTVCFDQPRPWVGSLQRTRLVYVLLPSREVHTVEFDDLGETPAITVREGVPYLFSAERARRVDLTNATSSVIPRAELGAAPNEGTPPSSARRALVFGLSNTSLQLIASSDLILGTRGIETLAPHTAFDSPGDAGSRCACSGRALVCGERRVEDACATVPGLVPLWRGRRSRAETVLTSPDGRFRLDTGDLTLLRLTRLRDGARLWVRALNRGAIVQADDGAWTAHNADPMACSVRWGRSLLRSPVTALDAHRAALLRPTLVEDFFSDRPLPAADLTQTPARE